MLTSHELAPLVQPMCTQPLPRHRTDHDAVYMTLRLGMQPPKSTFCSLNTSLLKHAAFTSWLHALYQPHLLLLPLREGQSWSSFWQALTITIRREAKALSSQLARTAPHSYDEAVGAIRQLEAEVQSGNSLRPTDHLLHALHHQQLRLADHERHRLDGLKVRSHSTWATFAHKPTPFFHRRLASRKAPSSITALRTAEGAVLLAPEAILERATSFYQHLDTPTAAMQRPAACSSAGWRADSGQRPATRWTSPSPSTSWKRR
jgi:hypothetical protein